MAGRTGAASAAAAEPPVTVAVSALPALSVNDSVDVFPAVTSTVSTVVWKPTKAALAEYRPGSSRGNEKLPFASVSVVRSAMPLRERCTSTAGRTVPPASFTVPRIVPSADCAMARVMIDMSTRPTPPTTNRC